MDSRPEPVHAIAGEAESSVPTQDQIDRKISQPVLRILGDALENSEGYVSRWVVNRGAE
ncbi:MAG: hypothetical protein HY717_21495 [Planctomycetes bacterium]|nr:hypothetical protein [Planctomycetota bacterium]